MARSLSPEQREKNRLRSNAWAAKNRERSRERAKAWYQANREAVLAREKAIRDADPEASRAKLKKRYAARRDLLCADRRNLPKDHPQRIAARARTKAWREANPDRKVALDRSLYERNRGKRLERAKQYRVDNPDRVRAQNATKKASRAQRTPTWLTAEQRQQIRKFYAEAIRLSREGNTEWHVDHIVPLRGKFVSGLHVPWNLQLLPAGANMKKHNKFSVEA